MCLRLKDLRHILLRNPCLSLALTMKRLFRHPMMIYRFKQVPMHRTIKLFCFVFCTFYFVRGFSQIDSVGSLKSGIAQFNQGNYEGAEVELNKAVELNPKNPDAFFYL